MMADEQLLEWAMALYELGWQAGPVSRIWVREPVLTALRAWLDLPAQARVLKELQFGLAQLGWDTPSSSGKRLLSDLLWKTILAQHGVHPKLHHPAGSRKSSFAVCPEFSVRVIDLPYSFNQWPLTGWYVDVDSIKAEGDKVDALEWLLNAVIYYDVELGLTQLPLYRRRHRRSAEFQLDSEELQPEDQAKIEIPACPKCGKPMVRKTRNRGGKPFWGCASYPICDGARQWPASRC